MFNYTALICAFDSALTSYFPDIPPSHFFNVYTNALRHAVLELSLVRRIFHFTAVFYYFSTAFIFLFFTNALGHALLELYLVSG
jgi:hypothetical protein